MRVVERYWAERACKARPKIEARIVCQQGAGDDGRMRRSLELDDHARARTHDAVRRLAEDSPARLGDLRNVGRLVHLREDRQRDRVGGIDREAQLREQPGEAAAQLIDRKSTRLNSSHIPLSRMPSS